MKSSVRRVPGEAGIWVFTIGDLIVFGMFFLIFVYERGLTKQIFSDAHLLLNRGIGLFNTILLLTSSLLVALGLHRVKLGRRGGRGFITAATLCGICFVVMKITEYVEKARAGITPLTNDFFMFYFVLTGMHLFHVVLGVVVLLVMRSAISVEGGLKVRTENPQSIQLLESGAIFWHLVDVIWIILFTLFYVLGG